MENIKPTLNLQRPIVFFDFETTGVDPVIDRIVEISAQKVNLDGSIDKFYSLVNPQRPIPAEASAVNKITDEMVKDAPKFCEIAENFLEFIGDSDLGGYNIIGYDIPCLIEECQRCGLTFRYGNRNILDAFYIFTKKFPRNLTTAVQFFLGEELEDAHSAEADTTASMRVFFAQAEKYGFVSSQAAFEFVKEGLVDLKGCLRRNEETVIVFGIGKYKNIPVLDVQRRDPGYIQWFLNNANFASDTRKHLQLVLKGIEK